MSSVALSKPLAKKKKPKDKVDYSAKRSLTKNRLFLLKWLGLILVIGDNITYAFSETLSSNVMMVCGTLGCLCFPLFAYYLVEHFYYCKNHNDKSGIKNTFKWLCLLGILSEIPFDLMKSSSFINLSNQNIFLTLAAIYLILIIYNTDMSSFARKICFKPDKATSKKVQSNERLIKFDIFTVIMLLTAFGNFDYGGEGVIFVMLLSYSRKKKHMKIIQFLAFTAYMLTRFNIYYLTLLFDFIIILFAESKIEKEVTENTKKIVNSSIVKTISNVFYFLQIAVMLMIKLFMTANYFG